MNDLRTYDIRYTVGSSEKYSRDVDRGTLEYAARALEAYPEGTEADCVDGGEAWTVVRLRSPSSVVLEGEVSLADGWALGKCVRRP